MSRCSGASFLVPMFILLILQPAQVRLPKWIIVNHFMGSQTLCPWVYPTTYRHCPRSAGARLPPPAGEAEIRLRAAQSMVVRITCEPNQKTGVNRVPGKKQCDNSVPCGVERHA